MTTPCRPLPPSSTPRQPGPTSPSPPSMAVPGSGRNRPRTALHRHSNSPCSGDITTPVTETRRRQHAQPSSCPAHWPSPHSTQRRNPTSVPDQPHDPSAERAHQPTRQSRGRLSRHTSAAGRASVAALSCRCPGATRPWRRPRFVVDVAARGALVTAARERFGIPGSCRRSLRIRRSERAS